MRKIAALLAVLALAACAETPPAKHGRVGDYYPGSAGLTIGTTAGTAYDGGQGFAGTTSSASITANAITVPASGTAPTGATQITAARNTITSCPTNGAVQLTAGPALPSSQGVMLDNRTANACLVYPAPGGTIGALAANVPAMLPPGHVYSLYTSGPSALFGSTAAHRSYIISGVTVTVPAIGANTTANVTAVSGNSMVLAGDTCTITVTSTTTLPAGLIIGGVTNTGTAGQILIRAANVQTLATTASASVTASFSCQGP